MRRAGEHLAVVNDEGVAQGEEEQGAAQQQAADGNAEVAARAPSRRDTIAAASAHTVWQWSGRTQTTNLPPPPWCRPAADTQTCPLHPYPASRQH